MPGIIASPAYGANVIDPNGAKAGAALDQLGTVFQDFLTPALKQQAYLKQLNQNQGLAGQADNAANLARNLPVDPGTAARHNVYSGTPNAAVAGTAAAVIPTQGGLAPAVTSALTLDGKYTSSPAGVADAQKNAVDLQNNNAANTPKEVLSSTGAPTFSNNRAVATGTAGQVQPILSDGTAKGAVIQNSNLLPHLAPGAQVAPLTPQQGNLVGLPTFAQADPATVARLGLPAGTNVEQKSDGSLTAPADLQSPGTKAIAPGFANLVDGQIKDLQASQTNIVKNVLPSIDSLRRISTNASNGIYAGKGAEFQTEVASVLAKMGIGDPTKLANTQAFNQSVAQEVLRNSQALGGGRGVTRGNMALTRLANGIDTEVSPEALNEMIDVNNQNAQSQILRHNQGVANLSQVPGFGGIEKLLGVDPNQYGAASRVSPTNAQPAPAAAQPIGMAHPVPASNAPPPGMPAGAFAGADGQFYVPDTARPGKFLHVGGGQ